MNVLSLFDGMACGMIAMQNAGINIDRYVAYEIDKYAIQTAKHNFSIIEECGDVFTADFTQYEGFDWLIGGSPCTHWSIAQTKHRETTASGVGWELFSQYVRALRESKPRYFLYENNKSMSKEIRASISETFGFDPICINSALVSAQNRQRLYWVGIRQEDGSYRKADIEQPEDRGIILRDILDGAVSRDLTNNDKSYTLTASYDGACPWNTIERHQRNMIAEPVCVASRGRNPDRPSNRVAGISLEQRFEAREDGKTNTLTSVEKDNRVAEPVCMRYERTDEAKACRKAYEAHEIHHGYHELHEMHPRTDGKTNTLSTVLKDNPICEPVRVGALPRPNGELSTSAGFRVYSIDGKSVTLKGEAGGAGGKTGLYAISVKLDENCKPTKAQSLTDGKIYTVYEVKDGLITIKNKTYPIKLADGFWIIRKLTVAECKRLQTVPEWYEFPVSDTQAYKLLGNGWTCDVIAHLIKACLD